MAHPEPLREEAYLGQMLAGSQWRTTSHLDISVCSKAIACWLMLLQ